MLDRIAIYSVIELDKYEIQDVNGGNRPADWDSRSSVNKAGYAIGHATMVTLEFLGALLPWV